MLENPYTVKIKSLDDLEPLSRWAKPSIDILREHMKNDPAHDEAHLLRIVRNALWFSEVGIKSGDEVFTGDRDVSIPAALLHDLVNVPKDSPDRNKASLMSADKAIDLLEDIIPFKAEMHHIWIHHAIEAHSYSANVIPRSVEAMAVQDADRLDAMGLLGIARLFSVGGSLQRALFHPTDPTVKSGRDLDENTYTLDHFYTKLIKLPETMQTDLGRRVANIRVGVMLKFIEQLVSETEGVIVTCQD